MRFAPSPTGALHIGGARTALYNWLQARHDGGELVLRIEDTDRERSTPENVEQILDALGWLELDWDEGPLSQAGRADRHRERLEELLEADRAYHSLATAEAVKTQKQQTGNLGFRGELSFDNAVMDDPVIARADGSVLYNFAVAIDDVDMGITDVIRGDDHLSNTPKQVIVMEQLGEQVPRYAHLPLLHGPDGKKLSKRHGAASVQELREAGYLPAAVRNYMALLGWGTDDDTTIMGTEELVRRFDVRDAGTASAIFDEKKLRWLNGRFMRELPLEEYTALVARYVGREPDEALRAACAIAQEKAQTLAEVWPLIAFLFEEPEADQKAWRKVMKDDAPALLESALAALEDVEPFEPGPIEDALAEVLERSGAKPGKLYQPIRVAISGGTVSPGIFESLATLGRERSLARIKVALDNLSRAST